jgi:hypothetical protein
MSSYKVSVKYADGSLRTFETTDGPKAMHEISSSTWEEDQLKTVSLEKDGESLFSEKVKAYKSPEH